MTATHLGALLPALGACNRRHDADASPALGGDLAGPAGGRGSRRGRRLGGGMLARSDCRRRGRRGYRGGGPARWLGRWWRGKTVAHVHGVHCRMSQAPARRTCEQLESRASHAAPSCWPLGCRHTGRRELDVLSVEAQRVRGRGRAFNCRLRTRQWRRGGRRGEVGGEGGEDNKVARVGWESPGRGCALCQILRVVVLEKKKIRMLAWSKSPRKDKVVGHGDTPMEPGLGDAGQ